MDRCDACGVFLENDLTSDGYRYVEDAFIAYLGTKGRRGSSTVLDAWREAYSDDLDWARVGQEAFEHAV